jgi:hypothetical protein
MIEKTGRIFFISLIALILSVYLPSFYWMGFQKRIAEPSIYFSSITKDFFVRKPNYTKKTTTFTDLKGNKYSRSQMDRLMPIYNYRVLSAKGMMPDSVQGKKIDLQELRLNTIFIKVRPKNYNTPVIPVYPLFESKPKRFALEMPDDFFRFTDERIEFISAESNRVNEEMTNRFTSALNKLGFSYPAKGVYGNPTTRKQFDEGYFVVDNGGMLFHLKLVRGKPYCRKIDIPDDMDIKYISVKELGLREFYGLLITEDNRLFLITYDNYKLQRLPDEEYNSDEDLILISGNIFYRMINIKKEGRLIQYVTDRKYNKIAQHEEKWKTNDDMAPGIISRYIFPFEVNLRTGTSDFVNLYFSYFSYKSVFANIVFVFLLLLFYKKRRITVGKNIFNLVITFVAGIYGFFASLLLFDDE